MTAVRARALGIGSLRTIVSTLEDERYAGHGGDIRRRLELERPKGWWEENVVLGRRQVRDVLAGRLGGAGARSVVDLESGDAVHWLRMEGVVEELYDVAILPGVRRPMALGLKSDEIQRVISMAAPAPLFPDSGSQRT